MPNIVEVTQGWFVLSQCYEQTGQLKKAIEGYKKCVKMAPHKIIYSLKLSGTYVKIKQYDKAIATLSNALKHADKTDSIEVQHELIKLYQMNKQYDLAMERLKTLQTQLPDNLQLAKLQSSLYVKMEHWQKATQLYAKLYQMHPNDQQITQSYAWLLATCPQENLRDGNKALTLAQSMIAKNPTNAIQKLRILAASYAAMGNFDLASQQVQSAIDKIDILKSQIKEPKQVAALEKLLEQLNQRRDTYTKGQMGSNAINHIGEQLRIETKMITKSRMP